MIIRRVPSIREIDRIFKTYKKKYPEENEQGISWDGRERFQKVVIDRICKPYPALKNILIENDDGKRSSLLRNVIAKIGKKQVQTLFGKLEERLTRFGNKLRKDGQIDLISSRHIAGAMIYGMNARVQEIKQEISVLK